MVSVAEASGRPLDGFGPGRSRPTSGRCFLRYAPVEALSGDALRRHVLIKAAEKARRDALQLQRPWICPADVEGCPIRTLVIDLEVLCKGRQVCGLNGELTHRIWPRSHFRIFLETVQRLFRIVVWSRCGDAWTQAMLLALDPHQELLPRRFLIIPPDEMEDVQMILDDGSAVHAGDALIVATNRQAFGPMAQNVIEVEPCTMQYSSHYDRLLLDLAALLVQHLAVGERPTGPAAAAAATAVAPPLAVPEELRRLGLHAVRMGGCAPVSRSHDLPPKISVDVRELLPTASSEDPLGMNQDDEEEDAGIVRRGTSWPHLEFLELGKQGYDGGVGRDDDELGLNLDVAVEAAAAAQQREPQQLMLLALGDSLASGAASCFSEQATPELRSTSLGSLGYSADGSSRDSAVVTTAASSRSRSSSQQTGDSSGSSICHQTSFISNDSGGGDALAAASCADVGTEGGELEGAKARWCQGEQAKTPSEGQQGHNGDFRGGKGGGLPKPYSALARLFRKVRGAASAPKLEEARLTTPSRHAVAAPAALKRLTDLVSRPLLRRQRATSDTSSQSGEACVCPSGASANTRTGPGCSGNSVRNFAIVTPPPFARSPSVNEHEATAPGAAPAGLSVGAVSLAISACTDCSGDWRIERQRPSHNRIAGFCESLGAMQAEPAAPESMDTAFNSCIEGPQDLHDECHLEEISMDLLRPLLVQHGCVASAPSGGLPPAGLRLPEAAAVAGGDWFPCLTHGRPWGCSQRIGFIEV